jgi:hypothetical protein
MQQWNLSYERQLGKDWMVSATYVGNKTTHLWIGTELDPAVYIPGTCAGAACSTTANTNQRRVLYLANPLTGVGYSTLGQTDDGTNATFNALIVTTQHRFSDNYTVLANYTYSHCLSSGNFSGDVTGPTYQNPGNRNADYGNCSFDLRQNFNGSIVATSPKFSGVWMNRLLGNWQIAPLFLVHSGTPFHPTTGIDNSRTGVGLDRPNVGVFSLYGPRYFDIDLSLSRFFTIREGHRLEVRSEFFNVTNHVNFSNPTTSLRSSSFGVILAANDPRILQFSMKYSF